MKLTINLMRVTIMTLIALTTSFATYAIAQKNVVTFTIPDGYKNSLYGFCKDLALPMDTITKYNPIIKNNGLYIGASISLPANYVNMELLTEKGFTPSLLENAYDVQFSHLNNRPNTAKSGRASDLRTTTPKDTSTPVKQQVEAYCYDGHEIYKCELYLEDDYAIGYRKNNKYNKYVRKPKIIRNSKSDPSKVSCDPTIDYANHVYKYLDYYVNHPSEGPTFYFNLNIKVPITEEVMDNGIITTHSPTIKIDGRYLDPYKSDGSHMSMDLKVRGDRIIAYEDPFTGRFVDCDIPYRKKAEQPFGDYYDYTANVGKLVVSFLILKNVKDVYTEKDVDKKHQLKKNNDSWNVDIFRFLGINNTETNPNSLETMKLSYIVNFDGVISDVKVIESPDASLNKDVVNALLHTKAEPAERDLHKVNVQGFISIKVKRNMDNEQLFNNCKQTIERFLGDNERREAINYARQQFLGKNSDAKEMSLTNASKNVKKLAEFLDNITIELRKSVFNYGRDTYYTFEIIGLEKWDKIVQDLYKSKNDKQLYLTDLKKTNDAVYVDYLLNKMNDKVFDLFVNEIAKEKFGDNYYIPSDFSELTNIYTKSQSDKEFEEYWEKDLNKIKDFANDPQIADQIAQWKEDYYFFKLGNLRDHILSKDKRKPRGVFIKLGEWSNKWSDSVSRKINFHNTKPYMLYPLQGAGYYSLTQLL